MGNFRRKAAFVSVAAIAAMGLAPSVGMAATVAGGQGSAGACQQEDLGTPLYTFLDCTPIQITQEERVYDVKISYQNLSDKPVTVSPQILVESPDGGPFLAPSDVWLRRYDAATGQWQHAWLGTQTGTLFTRIPNHGQQLGAGDSLEADYQLVVKSRNAFSALIQPKVVVYNSHAE
ncbi:hypothetical protein [Streptomyces sp. NPDC005799]|uniref:hypothetical protein n=1 Tax=Streptomyces sp. NPDC005799 TaxID=3154678 RepID=UPI0033C373CC